ncbi:uncharacterized protein LOC117327671 [Pecten maximus]|uniref:uncharacterized protein LOC117327671 n=1 Tax=Pecten maximus TaxID=6579 RepID=UPI0014583FE2|nr:uncharacterized protein LOC117327671 [Pecten maximus]XP_033740642.1 uncharacterized protein LOC117327671 [Pecten maximus]
MAEEEDSSSSSDMADDPSTDMSGKIGCIIGIDINESLASGLSDVSMNEGHGTGQIENNEDDDDSEDVDEGAIERNLRFDNDDDTEDDSDEEFHDCNDLDDDAMQAFDNDNEEYSARMCYSLPADLTLEDTDGEWDNDEGKEVEETEIKEVEMPEQGENECDDKEESMTVSKTNTESFSSHASQVSVPVEKVSPMYLGQQAVNCAKLIHLSITTCQEVMREILKFSNPHGREDHHLVTILTDWERTLSSKRYKKQTTDRPILSAEEKEKLFSGTVTYDKLDMSLLYKIARNKLKDNILAVGPGNAPWNDNPPGYDMRLQACVDKLRIFRNWCSHLDHATISDKEADYLFTYIKEVIVETEKHVKIRPQYSLKVDYIQNGELSPYVAEQQEKIRKLETERDETREGALTDLKTHLDDLKESLKKCFSDLEMFDTNVNGQDAKTKKYIESHERSNQYYAETSTSRDAMDKLKLEHCVVITGYKGSGKTALAYHLLYQLMSLGRCKVHVSHSLSDVEKIFSEGFFIALIELDEIKPKHREQVKRIKEGLISPDKTLSLYIIMTSNVGDCDEILDIINHVDLSLTLGEDERRSILTQQLRQEVKKTGALSHQPTPEELTEIVKESSCPLGFPMAASLYAQNDNYRRLGLAFFRSPVDYYLSEVKKFCKGKATHALLLRLVLQETDHSNKDDVSAWIRDSQSKVDEKSVRSACKRINGFLIVPSSASSDFQLRNACVQRAACMYLMKDHLQHSIKCLGLEYIVDTSILSCREENTGNCVQILSDDTDKKVLAERFFREILEEKSISLVKSDAWLDSTFTDIFIDVLVAHVRNIAEEKQETEACACIETLFQWAVLHRCIPLCKGLVKYIGRTFSFDKIPEFIPNLLKKLMLDSCEVSQDPLFIADREVTKIDLLRIFVKKKTCCNFCQPIVSCRDDEGLRYLLSEGTIDQEPDWGFWKFLTSAAAEGDTLLCNCDFVRLVCLPTQDHENNARKEDIHVAEFAEKVKSLKDDSALNKQHFFFSCIETIGLNQSLMSAMRQHKFDILATNNEEEKYNALHVAICSKLPCKQLRNTILALTDLELQQQVNQNGDTPLMMAVQQEGIDISSINILLSQNADPNFSSLQGGYAALHLCIMSSLDDDTVSKMVSILKNYNADIYKQSSSGQTPVNLAISKGISRLKTLGSLVKANHSHPQATQYMLHYCVQLDLDDTEKKEVFQVLIREGASVNQRDDKGLTPIMLAIQKTKENTDLVRQLLDSKADVRTTDYEGLSPLHHCCSAKQMPSKVALKIAKLIIELDDACLEEPDEKQKTPLMHAITNENHLSADLVFYLIEKVTDVNAVDSGKNTVLHLSMKSHFKDDIVEDMVESLMNKAADPFVQNSNNLSCLMCGVYSPNGRLKSITSILRKTKDHYKPQTDLRGYNLLHLCVEATGIADEDVSKLCQHAVKCGESVLKKSKENESALELAVSSQSTRLQTICSMLSSSGMKITCEIYDLLKKTNKLSYKLLQLLQEHKVELDEECRDARFPYHDIIDDAQTAVDETIVYPLVRLGFDINQMNSRGESPLTFACRSQCTQAVLVALANESDIAKHVHNNETCLHLLAKSNRNDLETRDAMTLLMQIAKINVNQLNNFKRSALAESVIKQKMNSAQFLMQKDADPNKTDRVGKTTVHHCVEGDWCDDKACGMLDILVDGGAYIDRCDNKSASALTLASSHSSRSRLFTMLRLLELGADVCHVDRWGRSPISNCLTYLRGHRKATGLERACRLTALRLYGVEPFCKDNDDKTAVELCDNLKQEKEILEIDIFGLPQVYADIVKGAFASLDTRDDYDHIEYPVKKLTPGILQLMQYSAKFLHRELFDVCEDDADFDTMSDFLEIKEFEAR